MLPFGLCLRVSQARRARKERKEGREPCDCRLDLTRRCLGANTAESGAEEESRYHEWCLSVEVSDILDCRIHDLGRSSGTLTALGRAIA